MVKKIFKISERLKYWLIFILLIVIALRLYFIFYLGAIHVVPERLILFLGLFVMTSIWIMERNDKQRLTDINLSLVKAKNKIIQAHINTLKALVSALEAKDSYTKGHCERVTGYADKIAEAMKIDKDYRKIINNAASIHDIGKLKIKDEILNKPGKLNDEEWEVVTKHPEEAVKILSVLEFLTKEKEIILHHHEKYNGQGYPHGLKGEDIPLGSRIICVADSFDAMNSARAYRMPLSKEKIIEELEKGKGTQFDPEIANVFLNIFKKENF